MRRVSLTLGVMITLAGLFMALSISNQRARLDIAAEEGTEPNLPKPHSGIVPLVMIAKAVGWAPGTSPKVVPGLKVQAFATGLAHPRWLLPLANGDVLVAETNAPDRPDDNKGVRGQVLKIIMGQIGAGRKSPNRITLLRGLERDGMATSRTVLVSGLNSPFGMALVGDNLYIADTDALLRFRFRVGQTRLASEGAKFDLPAGRINHHWTKNVIASEDGSRLYVTVGSNSNIGENGAAAEEGRAAIWEINADTGEHRIYASGLRNPNGLAFLPGTDQLWTVVNERDELGSDLVPDYLTSVKSGGFYGWPRYYWGGLIDERVKGADVSERPPHVIRPDYALGSHTASLGLAFANQAKLGARFTSGVFIGQHGSWNRWPRSGYKVVFVPFINGSPQGKVVDVLTGFLSENGEAQGRPVGVAIDSSGALLVADDVGNAIWRVSAQ